MRLKSIGAVVLIPAFMAALSGAYIKKDCEAKTEAGQKYRRQFLQELDQLIAHFSSRSDYCARRTNVALL